MSLLDSPPESALLQGRDYARLRAILNDALSRGASMPLSDSLTQMAETASQIIGCGYAAVIVSDEGGELTHFVPVGVSGETVARIGQLPTIDGLLGEVVEGGRTLRVPDIAVERGSMGLPDSHPPIKELLGVPIRAAGEVTGGLFLAAHSDSEPFDIEDEHTAQVIATAAGFLVDRARAAEDADRRRRWLISSTELTRELLAGAHPDPMQVLVERVLSVADADLVIVAMPSSDGRSLVATSAAGEHAELVRDRVIERDGTVTDSVIESGEPQIVTDLAHSKRHRFFSEVLGVDSALLVPMSGGAARLGTLALFRYAGRRSFSDTEVDMASTFAAQMVLALELAEARADRERAALFAERERIARDLHDHVIQQLFAVGMSLQATAGQVEDKVGERLQTAVDDLDATIMQIRSTIYRLTGPVLANNTLRSQAETLVRELEPTVGFPIDFEVRGPIDFGVADAVSEDIIAVLRESVTNAARHAHATRVTVRLTVESSGFTLAVRDDGRGMRGATRRSGLANLRARAEQHGGSMIIDTGAQGTSIIWSVPGPDAS